MATSRRFQVGVRGRVVQTILTLLMMNIALASIFGGLQQFFLPSRVGVLAPGDKMTALAVLSATGAAAAAIANPLAGHFSDRTRTAWGRRTPWLTGCTVAAIASLALLGIAPSTAAINISYAVAMLALGAFQAVLSALVPEEVPVARRGTVVAILTAGLTLGPFFGVSLFIAVGTTAGLSVLALGLLTATIAHVKRTRDPWGQAVGSSQDQAVPAGIAQMFNSLRDPDFRWVVLARSILMLGFWAVVSYQLFMLTDLVGTEHLPGRDPGLALAILVGCNASAAIASLLVIGPCSDWFGHRRALMIIAAAGCGASYIIPVLSPSWPGVIAFSIANGLFFAAFFALNQSVATLVLPDPGTVARDLGLVNIAATVPQIIGPLLGVLILVLFDWSALFIAAACFAALGALAASRIRPVPESKMSG